MCPRCLDEERRNHLPSRRCAFDLVDRTIFSSDNFMCGTMLAAWMICNMTSAEDRMLLYGANESILVMSVPSPEWGGTDGWIVLTRYKLRGRTTSAIWVGDWEVPRPVTLALMDKILSKIP